MDKVLDNERKLTEEKTVQRPRCKHCGDELLYTAKYCPRCGEELY